MPSISCCVCNKAVTRTNNAVTCAKCLLNYHIKCINLTEKAASDILNGTTHQWFCSSCDKSKSKANTSNCQSINSSPVTTNVKAFYLGR